MNAAPLRGSSRAPDGGDGALRLSDVWQHADWPAETRQRRSPTTFLLRTNRHYACELTPFMCEWPCAQAVAGSAVLPDLIVDSAERRNSP